MTLPARAWAALVLILALAFALSPLLVPDFGGFDDDAFPVAQINPPVQPAGYAFAIWGLIYLWLVISGAFGLFWRGDAIDWMPMRPTLCLSLGVGATWLVAAKASPLAATLLIWVMLVSALMAVMRAPLLDRWWAQAPVAIYAGWLSAASFVSVGLCLAGYGITTQTTAALIALWGAIVTGVVVQIRLDGAPEYGLSILWALIAVIIANLNGPGVVLGLAGFGVFLIGLVSLRAMTR